jgi:FixJ family two-component response regulator
MSSLNGGVAVVDDEVDLVRTYEILFKRNNIPLAFRAYDGEDAIDSFRNASPRPKVVIIDYRLPSMLGVDVMKEILAIEPETSVIMISGDVSIGQECLDAGAKVFLKKPTALKVITDTINSLLN